MKKLVSLLLVLTLVLSLAGVAALADDDPAEEIAAIETEIPEAEDDAGDEAAPVEEDADADLPAEEETTDDAEEPEALAEEDIEPAAEESEEEDYAVAEDDEGLVEVADEANGDTTSPPPKPGEEGFVPGQGDPPGDPPDGQGGGQGGEGGQQPPEGDPPGDPPDGEGGGQVGEGGQQPPEDVPPADPEPGFSIRIEGEVSEADARAIEHSDDAMKLDSFKFGFYNVVPVYIDEEGNETPVDEIPDGGISFLLPYPSEIDLSTHDYEFVVFHLRHDGVIEILDHQAEANGLRVTAESFSPFAVAYKGTLKQEAAGDPGEGGQPGGDPGEGGQPGGDPGEGGGTPPEGDPPGDPPGGEGGGQPPEGGGGGTPPQGGGGGGTPPQGGGGGGAGGTPPGGDPQMKIKTGDDTNIALWVMVMILCGGTALLLLPQRKINR